MSRSPNRRFRPSLDTLEAREVLSATPHPGMVHVALAPKAIPIAVYNDTMTKIDDAFSAYAGTYDEAVSAIGSAFWALVLPNNTSVDTTDDSTRSDTKGNDAALHGWLQTAVGQLHLGPGTSERIIHRTFELGGLTTDNTDYFKSKLKAIVRHDVGQAIKRGEVVLTWPGQAHRVGRS